MPRPRPKPRPSFRNSWELPVGEAMGFPVVVAAVEVFTGEEKVLDVNDVVEDADEVVGVEEREEERLDVEDEVVDEDEKDVDIAEPCRCRTRHY